MLHQFRFAPPRLTQIVKLSLPILFIFLLPGPPSLARQTSPSSPNESISRSPNSLHPPASPPHSTASSIQSVIPPGTILPVRLRTAISSQKSKSGQLIIGKIAQDIPLPDGSKIRAGSRVEGQLIEVIPAGTSSGPKLSLRFDKVYAQGSAISVTTNLRAIAGFMEVQDAGVPVETTSEGTPFDWLPTTQIGGDSVYGLRGPVMSAEDPSQLVGKSTYDGVLARPRAKKGTECRGAAYGNDNPQALWVFSTDACGAYGIEHLNIVHAGRTAPEGTIVLASQSQNLKLRNGDALLLRVDE